MTPSNDSFDGHPGRDGGPDRILDHQRQQLSALTDGELSPDEARFLLRRLQHDQELLGCWERWQLAGEVMRGRAELPMPVGFARGVADAVARERKTTATPGGSRWLRWGSGAALAASAAVIALLLSRQAPDAAPVTSQPTPIAATSSFPPPPVAPIPDQPAAPAKTAELATVLAVADVPRRIGARRSRGQSQRAALRTPNFAVARLSTPVGVSAPAAAAIDPFSGEHISLPNRSWPRPLLQTSHANGAFTVDYGRANVPASTLYPFTPHPAEQGSSDPDR